MELGKVNRLTLVKLVDFGAYLAEGTKDQERVLLPAKQVPQGIGQGDSLDVFLYKDSSDRLIATMARPLAMVGQFAPMKVKELTKIGAFLDWGLEKDLLLPYRQMLGRVEAGDQILARVYVDKSQRLAASMKEIYPMLRSDSPYQAGDEVRARVYEFSRDFGTFVAVDDIYSAMIPRHEDARQLRIGDQISCRVTGVKRDGKLDVSIRGKSYETIGEDAEAILQLLESYAGVLPFTEKASSEVIRRETGLSKNAFKRAVGHLYKEGRVSIEDGKIRRTEKL
ncbi:S1 domain protein [Shuttleworthella sp. MSX8B]|uniref:CvfB family protein n=1 Tax=Shuttleworthella sp. MSX8B TaxID=936574 RepID=UPI00044F3A78|nr:S1-like domain-containing RNA-binding protein [Shuttleworthia sp. MSX8B]EUB15263.1 S1 domain protein [Shuttleworthia sp. MSX8B]